MKFINEDQSKNLCGIYKITQISNGRIYIGQTKMRFIKRYWHHVWKLNDGSHDNNFLQNAWNKYGESDFMFEVVEIMNRDENMNKQEIMYIEKYDTYHNGFNMTLGGEGKKGTPMSEQTKEIVGRKNRIHMLGKKHTEETKRKMSLSSHRRKITSEHAENLRKSRLGSKHSESSKQKMKEAKLGVGSAINESQAFEIKNRLINGDRIIDIANELDIEYHNVKSILQEKVWTHIKVDGWGDFIVEYKKRKKESLTDDQVREIRNLIDKGYSAPEISKLCDIGVSVVYGIKQNRTYKNVK